MAAGREPAAVGDCRPEHEQETLERTDQGAPGDAAAHLQRSLAAHGSGLALEALEPCAQVARHRQRAAEGSALAHMEVAGAGLLGRIAEKVLSQLNSAAHGAPRAVDESAPEDLAGPLTLRMGLTLEQGLFLNTRACRGLDECQGVPAPGHAASHADPCARIDLPPHSARQGGLRLQQQAQGVRDGEAGLMPVHALVFCPSHRCQAAQAAAKGLTKRVAGSAALLVHPRTAGTVEELHRSAAQLYLLAECLALPATPWAAGLDLVMP